MGEHSRYVFGDHSHPCDSKSTGVALRGSRTNPYDCGVDITRGLVLLGVSAPRRRALLLLQINEGAPRRVHQEPATGEVPMTSSDDWRKTVRLNKLLGMWAAEKLGITGRDAEAYSDALAVGTLDPERSDVLSKIRKDFDAAGVVQSDEQMLRVLNELTLQAGGQMPSTRGGAADTLTVMLARKLKPE
jgi:hypothetical protein